MNGSSSDQVSGTPGTQSSIEQEELEEIVTCNENTLVSSMPNHEEAVTPREKFTEYSLNPENPNSRGKAEAYRRALGYTRDNADSLINQIINFVSTGNAPYEVSQSPYGSKYKYRIPVTGPNGKTKNVIAVYQIDNGKKIPRMITNYLEGKKQ